MRKRINKFINRHGENVSISGSLVKKLHVTFPDYVSMDELVSELLWNAIEMEETGGDPPGFDYEEEEEEEEDIFQVYQPVPSRVDLSIMEKLSPEARKVFSMMSQNTIRLKGLPYEGTKSKGGSNTRCFVCSRLKYKPTGMKKFMFTPIAFVHEKAGTEEDHKLPTCIQHADCLVEIKGVLDAKSLMESCKTNCKRKSNK